MSLGFDVLPGAHARQATNGCPVLFNPLLFSPTTAFCVENDAKDSIRVSSPSLLTPKPGMHSHPLAPAADQAFTAHSRQADAPVASLYLPAGQGLHKVDVFALAVPENLPAGNLRRM